VVPVLPLLLVAVPVVEEVASAVVLAAVRAGVADVSCAVARERSRTNAKKDLRTKRKEVSIFVL